MPTGQIDRCQTVTLRFLLDAASVRAAASTRVLKYYARVVNYLSNFLLLEYSFISISG